jgi:hypothetical protein
MVSVKAHRILDGPMPGERLGGLQFGHWLCSNQWGRRFPEVGKRSLDNGKILSRPMPASWLAPTSTVSCFT